MEKQKKIIDASVIVKWFADEEDSKKALTLRQDHIKERAKIIVPELIFAEVLNALHYKGKSEERLKEANQALWDLQLQIEKTNIFLLNKAIELSIKHEITLYDAIYLALANVYGCPLITADLTLGKLPNTILLNKS